MKKEEVPQDRSINLDQVDFATEVFTSPCFSCARGYVAETSALGAELIGKASVAHNLPRQPNGLKLLRSVTHPGDIVGKPVMGSGSDVLTLTWSDQGKVARAHLGKLMSLLSIKVPKRTRMVVKLYPDVDPDHGPVVGFQIAGMEFVPIETRKKTTNASRGQAADNKDNTKNDPKNNPTDTTTEEKAGDQKPA